MTSICGMALGKRPIPRENNVEFATANFLLPSGQGGNAESNSTSGGDVGDGMTPIVNSCMKRSAVSLINFFLDFNTNQ